MWSSPALRGAVQGSSVLGDVSSIQELLVAWYKVHGRAFPWRSTTNAFHVLIAEKLLQQTAAKPHVVEVYYRIAEIAESACDLLKVTPAELEHLMRPLGLRYRANELRLTSAAIVACFDGRVPSSLSELLSLPGIGDYSARAILCFAFDQPVPIVDVNVARIFFRVLGFKGGMPKNPARSKSLLLLAEKFLPYQHVKDFNWALIDLGSLVCTARNPRCSECPLLQRCSFGRCNHEEVEYVA